MIAALPGRRTAWLCARLRGYPTARPLQRLLLTVTLLGAGAAMAQPVAFSFGVIAPGTSHPTGDAGIREAIVATDAENLAFVVSSGIKTTQESCSDKLLFKRKELFQAAKNGLILSLAASDWSSCKTATGRSLAIERLSRIRDLFFEEEFSFGASKLPLSRQASTPKFRTYVENLRWDIGSMVFATLHLPANNNDFIAAAGRNSEFEDRMIADRDWLHRIFGFAVQKGAAGIVLFCDGNPMAVPDARGLLGMGARRDGFAEIRKQITTLSARFNGKVVLIHGQTADAAGTPTALTWRGNLGDVAVAPGWLRMTVDPASPTVLSLSTPGSALRTASQ